jgi:hypothetical protein
LKFLILFFQNLRVVLVDHNVDADFPLSVVVEVLDHHVNEIPPSSSNSSSLRHSKKISDIMLPFQSNSVELTLMVDLDLKSVTGRQGPQGK